jgi:hypothetical protein
MPRYLVVAGRCNPELDMRAAVEAAHREHEATIEVGAVCRDEIDLLGRIGAFPEALRRAPRRVTPNDDDRAFEDRRLALDTEQSFAHLEDQTGSTTFGDRAIDGDAGAQRSPADRRLCDRALLIRREHATNCSSLTGQTTSTQDQAE